ncbi:hypothetical protein SM11_chr1083 [Sinorhizobium meliloti SM11]|uniref:Uncharacterized protein n=4 Tax=Rhizobium meliloti TaxID=382 RepID=F7X3F6_SINMM|nr:hypothetical protein SM11_chr1083 [Sinorhizobium meliloti SM11]
MSKRKQAGRPPHEPSEKDRKMVEVLSGFAVPTKDIAEVVGITQATLFKHYRDQLRRGGALVQAKLVANLLRIASGSDGTALKAITFALQCRFGWSQYVPRPDGERDRPPGKKEIQQREAETAHTESDWGRLLN